MSHDSDAHAGGEDGGDGGHLITTRRAFLVTGIVAASGIALGAGGVWDPARSGSSRPLALVYRGPAASPGIPEDTAAFLRTCAQRFRVAFCGPGRGDLPVDAATLARAALYVQPGGPGQRTVMTASSAPCTSAPRVSV